MDVEMEIEAMLERRQRLIDMIRDIDEQLLKISKATGINISLNSKRQKGE